MKTLPLILSVTLGTIVCVPNACAQGTASTASNFGVLATDGTNTGFHSQASGTPVGRGLSVHAAVASAPRTLPVASAESTVAGAAFHLPGSNAGLVVSEHGGVNNTGTGTLSAGTSADAPGTASPTQGAHSVALNFAVANGTAGTVEITWNGQQSAGASVTGAVDVDGDGVPDWTGQGGTPNHTSLNVTAGANGVTITITTNGSASVTGPGREHYSATLLVSFRTGSTTPLTFTWTSSGPQCLGSLTGTQTVGTFGEVALHLAVAGGAANGIGVLLTGTAAASPISLPSGTCQLLVDPNGAGLGILLTDASGNGAVTLHTRAHAMTADFQALTLGFTGGALGTTDMLNLTVQ
jgi:hypothetical protein